MTKTTTGAKSATGSDHDKPAPKRRKAPAKKASPTPAKKPAKPRARKSAAAKGAQVSPGQKEIPAPKRNGRPPFKPTREQREHVETLAGLGLRQPDIALMVKNPTTGKPVDEKTLRAHFAKELAEGVVKANAKIAQSLFQKATGDGSQAVTACIWWTKCRMGWKEHVAVDVEIKSGVLVAPGAMGAEEWIAKAIGRTGEAHEPGAMLEGPAS